MTFRDATAIAAPGGTSRSIFLWTQRCVSRAAYEAATESCWRRLRLAMIPRRATSATSRNAAAATTMRPRLRIARRGRRDREAIRTRTTLLGPIELHVVTGERQVVVQRVTGAFRRRRIAMAEDVGCRIVERVRAVDEELPPDQVLEGTERATRRGHPAERAQHRYPGRTGVRADRVGADDRLVDAAEPPFERDAVVVDDEVVRDVAVPE